MLANEHATFGTVTVAQGCALDVQILGSEMEEVDDGPGTVTRKVLTSVHKSEKWPCTNISSEAGGITLRDGAGYD